MAPAAAGADFDGEIRPLITQFCASCHNADRTKGDVDLDRFQSQDMAIDSIAVWTRAGMRVRNGEMPPGRAPQPTQEEKDRLLAWIEGLEKAETDCNRIANEESVSWYPGYVMSRRLNRFEYENTIADLLGVDLQVAEEFPSDGAGGEGFDNNGNALFLSAIQAEKYLEVADQAVETALPRRRGGPLGDLGRFLIRAITFDWKKDAQEKQVAAARTRIITARPGGDVSARAAAEKVLHDFLPRAWRRPVSAEEVETLLGLFDRGHERGEGYVESLKLAFKGALVSPNFLFLAEPEPEVPGNYALGGYPLASRLSYFLWSSMPDEELFSLAADSSLQDPAVLRAQVERMLRDPKAGALGEQFALQWLGVSQLGKTTRPDAERFPQFDPALAGLMQREAAMFFTELIANDRPLIELIDADYTFANERLAALYGLEAVAGAQMQRVQVADARRGGVVGMAAVLTATSHPLRTSPVLRGKWVLEQLLGDRVPPPPPDAGVLPEDDVHPEGLTLRQQLEAHRANPECASCHARMDPIGFGLEHFDPIGRWRDEQAGQPVDATGELPSGEKFTGPEGLKQILLARKDDVVRNLSRKMLGYALGRSLSRYDNCVVDDCVAALQSNEYRASHLFTEIVLSYPFRHRYSAGEAKGDTE